MELARALTTRRHKPTPPALNTAYLGRAASQRAPNAKPVRRQDISLPVELLSSTNVLTYEAPNIPDAPNARDRSGRYFKPSTLSTALSVSSSNNASDNDSDNSHSDHSHDTDATSIDLSSPESSHDPFSHFGKNAFPKPLVGTVKSVRSTASSEHEPTSPKIPARAPSHTRRAHVLSHTRSILSRERPARHSQSPSSPTSARHNSLDMFNSTSINMIAPPSPATPTTALPAAPVSYPFGKELEQLDEAQLDFASAVRDADMDADASAMRSNGLMRFCAADYLEEIAGLSPFAREPSYQSMAWI